MHEYKIEIEERLQRVVKVMADSKEESMRIVKEIYRNEKIVLGAEDFISEEFK